ncbi:MAG: hypothetical protein J7K46_07565 [Bacteroidales bacterium]|nr:hypothetical protein [Bacteroidales bacterium]
MKKIVALSMIVLSAGLLMTGCNEQTNPALSHKPGSTESRQKLQQYNVIWDSPSKDYNGSMPVGNGDIGLNVWVEESGDICFYIGKTDSWGDNGRLLKVGKVRVKCTPAIVFPGDRFKQELDLKTGTIRISSAGKVGGKDVDLSFQLWVDANHPVIHLTHECSVPVSMTANIELWRAEPYSLPRLEVSDLLEDRSKPGSLHEPVIVEPDHLIQNTKNYIGWYHYNKKSVGFNLNVKLQGLSDFVTNDPILHRTFGAIITGSDTKRLNDKSLTTAPEKSGRLNIYVLTKHPSQPNKWQEDIEQMAAEIESIPFYDREKAHMRWWSDFWDRSWIYATSAGSKGDPEDDDAYIVTRAYTLQRFIDACAGRGRYPVKFNGSIFTVPTEGMPGDADYRRWGPGYWWQNTRLPYLSMCASGDYDLMQPLFKMYADSIYKLSKKRTRKYFGFEGAYFPECMYFWGANFTATYGWTPYEEREDPLQESRWHKWEWISGLELVHMMLDYYDYTLDKEFLQDKILPVANDVLHFFDNYYKTDSSGRLVMHPSQALETWWDCTNPMPELAGMHSIIKRLAALPKNLTSESDRKFWGELDVKLPEIPLRETPSGMALAPAERFKNKQNVENPELYAVFPFRLIGVGNPDIEWGENALEHRWDKGHFGWRQDDIFMTYLGLTEQAKNGLVSRAKNYDKTKRFPAFWGPNYDWTPDQDHGGVLMKAFQSMLLQADPYSKKIYLVPAWPKEWNVDFKLHAPYNTIIEGTIKNGKIEALKVTPSSRKGDVIISEIN